MATNYPEADLVLLLGEWYRAQGFRTFCEVEVFGSLHRFDLVAKRGDELHVCEAKVGWSMPLRRQASRVEFYSPNAWAVIRRKAPGAPEKPRLCGYGLLIARPDDSIEIAWEPEPTRHRTNEGAVLRALTVFHETEVGGLPVIPGAPILNWFHSRVLETHRRMWIRQQTQPEPMEIGEVLDLCGDLVEQYRNPRASMGKILVRPCFTKTHAHPTRTRRQSFRANGEGMPDAAKPATCELVEIFHRP